MNQIATLDDLAAGRTAAARKAWETRRAQGLTHSGAHNSRPVLAKPQKAIAEEALVAFEREAASDMPDWHGVALALRRALEERLVGKMPIVRLADKAPALPPTRWSDYPVDKASSFAIRNPTIVVTFADGVVVRAPAVSLRGRPINIGRGLRVAIAFYSARLALRAGLQNTPGSGPRCLRYRPV